MMQISMELFMLELGMGMQPFQVNFNKYGALALDSWLKSLWEKANMFRIVLTESLMEILMPSKNDNWLMRILIDNGHNLEELIRLNWVQIHQHVLFVSDVLLDSSGRVINKKYLMCWSMSEKWSTYLFPHQSPPPKDPKLWPHALQGVRVRQVGKFINQGHKIWDWWYVEEEQIVLHRTSEGTMDVYTSSQVPRYAGHPNCWTCLRLD